MNWFRNDANKNEETKAQYQFMNSKNKNKCTYIELNTYEII